MLTSSHASQGILGHDYHVDIQELPSSKYSSIQSVFNFHSENAFFFKNKQTKPNQPNKKGNEYFWAWNAIVCNVDAV